MVKFVKFRASDVLPNPNEITYWVDLTTDEFGGSIKTWTGSEWKTIRVLEGTIIEVEERIHEWVTRELEALKEEVNNKVTEFEGLLAIFDLNLEEIRNTKLDNLTAGYGIEIKNNVVACVVDLTLYRLVSELPTTDIDPTKIYIVPNQDGEDNNIYTEYVYIEGKWEKIGEFKAEIDLSPYALKTEVAELIIRETRDREDRDDELGQDIASLAQLRDTLFAEITRKLKLEENLRTLADDNFNIALTEEIERSTNKDVSLTSFIESVLYSSNFNLGNEQNRAIAEEKRIDDRLSAEITRSTNKDNLLQTDLAAEVTRAKLVEVMLGDSKADKEATNAELAKKADKTTVDSTYAKKTELTSSVTAINEDIADITADITSINTSVTSLTNNKADKTAIPTKVSLLTNDSKYVITELDPTVPAHVKSITTGNITTWNNKSDFSGSYTDLTNKPTSMPASDVSTWAKKAEKPTYTTTEIGAEPAFTKNTGFNKNFGSAAGTVCEGNDVRLSNARPASGGRSDTSGVADATNKLVTPRSFSVSGAITGSTTFDGTANATIATTLSGFDAAKITTGTISIDRLPKGAIERLVVVANDAARFALTTTQVQEGDTVKVTGTGRMYFVVDDTKLSTEAGYEDYTVGQASSVPWSGVTSKPTTIAGFGITDGITAATANSTYIKRTGDLLSSSLYFDNGQGLYITNNTSTGGDASGVFHKKGASVISGIGAYTTEGNFGYHYIGWGAHPYFIESCLAVSSTKLAYKGNNIYHAGNFDPASYLPLAGGVMTDSIKFNTNNNGNANLSSGNGFRLFYNQTTGTNFPNNLTNVASFITGLTGFQLASYAGNSSDFYFRNLQDNGIWHPWKKILHSENYSSYALPLTGGTVSGDLTVTRFLNGVDTDFRSINLPYIAGSLITMALSNYQIKSSTKQSATSAHSLYKVTANNGAVLAFGGLGNYVGFYMFSKADIDNNVNNDSGSYAFNLTDYCMYHGSSMMMDAGNYNNWVPSKTGTGASGTWSISVTGTASVANRISNDYSNMAMHWIAKPGTPYGLWGGNDTTDAYVYLPANLTVGKANQLTTARTIWGLSFDGSANISGEISLCTRVSHPNGSSLFLGNANNDTWVQSQDICSQSGYNNWSLRITGVGHMRRLNLGDTESDNSNYELKVDGNSLHAGMALMYSTNVSGSYDTRAIQLREVGMIGNSQTNNAYAPAIGFHWGNVAGAVLSFHSDAKFHFTANTSQDSNYRSLVADGFVKAGSNADYVLTGDGGHLKFNTGVEANSLVRRTVDGHVLAKYFNASSGQDNLSISSVFYEASNDGFIRKKSLVNFIYNIEAERPFLYTVRDEASIAASVPTTAELTNLVGTGSRRINFSGGSGHLMQSHVGTGSTAIVQMYSAWNGSLLWRNSTNSDLSGKPWKTILDSSNYTNYISTIKGDKGDTGATGPQGPQGILGPQGLKGDTGSTGPIGPKGDTGSQGPTGPAGSNGSNGITPTVGSNGNWYLGYTDTGKPSRGATGAKGATGAQGPIGPMGQAGPLGATGPTGAKGADGLTTSVKLGGTSYTQSGGVISLPAYPTSLGISLITGIGNLTFIIDGKWEVYNCASPMTVTIPKGSDYTGNDKYDITSLTTLLGNTIVINTTSLKIGYTYLLHLEGFVMTRGSANYKYLFGDNILYYNEYAIIQNVYSTLVNQINGAILVATINMSHNEITITVNTTTASGPIYDYSMDEVVMYRMK